MGLSRVIITFTCLLTVSLFADTKLPILKTKQSLDNLRYISADGNITYYQRASGTLLLSTNYKVFEVSKSTKKTQYYVTATEAKKYVLIERNPTYHTFYDQRGINDILISGYGSDRSKLVGKGTDPQLHLGDQWYSFYQPYTKKLFMNNSSQESISFNVTLASTQNPYFIPSRIMPDANTVVFTDYNQKGFPGILAFSFSNKKVKVLKKYQSPNTQIKLCKINDKLIIAKTSFDSLERGTTISSISFKNFSAENEKIIYQSKENDIINLVCTDKDSLVYFFKTYRNEIGKLTYEAVSLNVKDKKVSVLGDLKFANQILNMDGNIFIPYLSNYYVLKGKSDFTDYDQLSKEGQE